MSSEEATGSTIRQPARGEPSVASRAPLDWGDEEPDRAWEELYNESLVSPPYRGRGNGQTIAELVKNWTPIGNDLTDEYLICALGRCDCCQ